MSKRGYVAVNRGFTLPTVMISSIVMLVMLLLALQIAGATANALRSQYQQQLATLAAEAGVARAVECLAANGNAQTWSSSKPLTAGTDCNGDQLSGCPAGDHCYLAQGDRARSNFSVGDLTNHPSGNYSFKVSSTVGQVSPNDGVVRTVANGSAGYVAGASGTPIDQPQIPSGAGWLDTGHIGTYISVSGQLYAYGYNADGQITDSASPAYVSTPTKIELPAGVSSVATARTSGRGASFVCIIGNDRSVWCRGYGLELNNAGWRRLQLPASHSQAVSIAVNGYGDDSVCALTTTARVYCAGSNDFGRLGNGMTSGKVPLASPTRLGYYHTWDELYSLSSNATCVLEPRYYSGQAEVWCAGMGYAGQVGPTTTESVSNPIFFEPKYIVNGYDSEADSRTRTAKDVLSNYHGMESIHVLTEDGGIFSRGYNQYGHFGGNDVFPSDYFPVGYSTRWDDAVWFGPMGGQVKPQGSSYCIGTPTSAYGYGESVAPGSQYALRVCAANSLSQHLFLSHDKQQLMLIRLAVYSGAPGSGHMARCVEPSGTSAGSIIRVRGCNSTSSAQRWEIREDGTIYHPQSGRCMMLSGSATLNRSVVLGACSPLSNANRFVVAPQAHPYLGMIAGESFICGIRKDSADCGGANTYGQLMNGTTINAISNTTRIVLPAGEEIDVELLMSGNGGWKYQHDTLQVITRSGKVYGAGKNTYGRLGDGTRTNRSSAVQFQLPAGVKAVDMSTSDEYTTYVLGDDGNVYAAGSNNNGQLGIGKVTAYEAIPQKVKLEDAGVDVGKGYRY